MSVTIRWSNQEFTGISRGPGRSARRMPSKPTVPDVHQRQQEKDPRDLKGAPLPKQGEKKDG